MATEITTTGSKKVKTLIKEFNEKFPYLRLGIFPIEMKAKVAKGETITQVDSEKTLSEIRQKTGLGEISINGRKLVGNLEKEFEEKFGIYVQVCYTTKEGKRYYTTGNDDKKSLTALNKDKENEGCQKDIWK